MPSINVTAVTTGTDTLTAVAHGLLTGDRFRLHNVGGALPAATPSLAGVTDYFAVRVDADNIKVATSSANALATTPIVIDITGSGSGTTTVEYGLPYCIPTGIAAPGSQMKSVDANGTWGSLVALYGLLTGQAQAIWSSAKLAVPIDIAGALTLSSLTPAVKSALKIDTTGVVSASADQPLQFPAADAILGGVASITDVGAPLVNLSTSVSSCWLTVPLSLGFKIVSWSLAMQKTSTTGTVTAELWKLSATGTPTQIGSTQVNSANNPGNISLGQSGLSTVVAAGETFSIRFFGGGGAPSDHVFGATITPG